MTTAGIHAALEVGDTASQYLFHRPDDFLPYARHQLLIVAADELPALGRAGQIGFGRGECAVQPDGQCIGVYHHPDAARK